MEQYLIVARSITQAQQMEQTLRREGVRATIHRAPSDIFANGCAYVVAVRPAQFAIALQILQYAGIPIRSVLWDTGREYREVAF